MEGRGLARALLHLLRIVAYIDLGIFGIAALICWLSGRWSARAYSIDLFWIGLLTIGIGVLSSVGGWSLPKSFSYQYGRSVSEQGIPERTRQDMVATLRSHSFLLTTLIAGAITVGIGVLIYTLWG